MAIDYASKIPNNVGLGSNRALQRALEHWQPRYLDWWREAGPVDAEASQVYLRTAVSVETGGWAHFDYVKMPDYRWGIFLTERVADRTIGFGDEFGKVKDAVRNAGDSHDPITNAAVEATRASPYLMGHVMLIGGAVLVAVIIALVAFG